MLNTHSHRDADTHMHAHTHKGKIDRHIQIYKDRIVTEMGKDSDSCNRQTEDGKNAGRSKQRNQSGLSWLNNSKGKCFGFFPWCHTSMLLVTSS